MAIKLAIEAVPQRAGYRDQRIYTVTMAKTTGDARAMAIAALERELASIDPFTTASAVRTDYRRALGLWLIDELDDGFRPLTPVELACRSLAEATVVVCDAPSIEAWDRWERAAGAYLEFKGVGDG